MSDTQARIAERREARRQKRDERRGGKRTPRTINGDGTVDMPLFGVTVTVKDDLPQRKPRLQPWMLVLGQTVPKALTQEVANYLAIAKNCGIEHAAITREVAEYIIKGHYEMAKKMAAQAA